MGELSPRKLDCLALPLFFYRPSMASICYFRTDNSISTTAQTMDTSMPK
jgi:hypothetical protein